MTHSSHSKLKNKHGRHSQSIPKPDLKLFVKDVDDSHGRKRPLTVKTWATVKDVKDSIQKLLHVPSSSQRLYFGPLMTSGSALPNHRSLGDAGIYRNGETLYLEIKGHGESTFSPPSSDGTTPSSSYYAQHSKSAATSSMSTLKPHGVNDVCISKSVLDQTPKPLRRILQQARRGLALGLKPDLVLDGSGGTYFLHDARKVRVAVFKPADEEPYAENNPRGYVRQGRSTSDYGAYDNNYDYDYSAMGGVASDSMSMRAGIKPGEACLREVAAYMLDHDSFTGVPMTTLAEARHPAFHSNGSMLKLNQGGAAVGHHSLQLGSSSLQPMAPVKKVGSCQEYVNGECSMDDLSPSKIGVEEVHKIAILDIRIMNADRNTANLLCRRDPEDPDFFELVPIDHGYCLRTVADVCWFDWCWLDWPQMKEPISKKTRSYILKLDIEEDARMLKERLNIPDKALDYFRASSKLLQAGVKCGMTLYDIAILCCRNDDSGELPSKLETLMVMASDISKSAVDNGRWHHVAASKALEQQLSPQFHPHYRAKQGSRGVSGGGMGAVSMFKSKSSMNFSSFASSISSGNPPTPMANSSGSDSSNTSIDPEPLVGEEECDEWAAALIADKFEPISKPKPVIASRRQRSISFARNPSDDDLSNTTSHSSSSDHSSSPGGFWFVPPSASKQQVEDDASSLWSPYISPALSPICPELSLGKGLDQEDLELRANSSGVVKFDISTLIPPKDFRTSNLCTVSSSEKNQTRNELDEEDNADNNTNTMNTSATFLNLEPSGALGIKRSQSYSAFSSFSRIIPNDEIAEASRAKQARESTEQLGHYFNKFVDLLIDREITPIIRKRQNSTSCSTTTTSTASNAKNGSNFFDMNMDSMRDQLQLEPFFE